MVVFSRVGAMELELQQPEQRERGEQRREAGRKRERVRSAAVLVGQQLRRLWQQEQRAEQPEDERRRVGHVQLELRPEPGVTTTATAAAAEPESQLGRGQRQHVF